MKFTANDGTTIDVQFCRDCKYFEPNYWQDVTYPEDVGWCRRLSYTDTYDDETPYYIYVTASDFCNRKKVAKFG